METRIIEDAYVGADFCDTFVLAIVCVNSEPAFRVDSLCTGFRSKLPTDIREKYTFKHVSECQGETLAEDFVSLEGALLWASRVPDGDKWVDYIKSDVVPRVKEAYDNLLACRQRYAAELAEATIEVARLERKLSEWKERGARAMERVTDLDIQLRFVEPA